MSPAACEADRPKLPDDMDAFFWNSIWFGGTQPPFDPHRIADTLPPIKRQSKSGSYPASASGTVNVENKPSDSNRLVGLIGAPNPQASPHLQAQTTRELIQAVREGARNTKTREVRLLRRKIESLTHEIESLKRGKTQHDLGDTITVYGLQIPVRLNHVITAIEESRSLIGLCEDWDGNGTPGFFEQTWERAARLLIDFAIAMAANHGVIAEDIEILPGANGGLDIDVRFGGRQLLFVVSSDPRNEVRFYGDDGNRGKQVKATLDPSKMPVWLSTWMAE